MLSHAVFPRPAARTGCGYLYEIPRWWRSLRRRLSRVSGLRLSRPDRSRRQTRPALALSQRGGHWRLFQPAQRKPAQPRKCLARSALRQNKIRSNPRRLSLHPRNDLADRGEKRLHRFVAGRLLRLSLRPEKHFEAVDFALSRAHDVL